MKKLFLISIIILFSVKIFADKLDLVPLKLNLPAPLFQGTGKDVKSSNLERTPLKTRKPFLIPEDYKLLSKEVEVCSSDEYPIIGETEFAIDGDKEGSDGSFVEYGPGLQYIQLNLAEESEIYAVVFWHFHSEARIYFDVVIQSADDPDFIVNIKTIFNNDHDNSSGLGIGSDKEYIETNQGKLIDGKSVKTRYLRFYSNGNTTNELNHYIEIEVYGK